jgi:Arabinose efflux permease
MNRSPLALPNIRLFVMFRVLFNARFYYPVFTILFLDYGLSLEQFALLNTVWAFTIVLAEVPSGALADLLGRKRLLVTTSGLMIAEMALLAFVPLGNPQGIFLAFLANRILSGLAEALASGADEALAYDTLAAHGLAGEWPRVLEVQMRAQSIGYMFAMTLGAVVYDPGMVNRILGWVGWGGNGDPADDHALPGVSHPDLWPTGAGGDPADAGFGGANAPVAKRVVPGSALGAFAADGARRRMDCAHPPGPGDHSLRHDH